MMETVEYLLSQKWENTFLNETFFEALVYLRGKDLHASNFFRETPIFLVDHPKLKLSNSDALVVNQENVDKKMIFVFKDELIKQLNNLSFNNTKQIENEMSKYIEKIGLNVMKENNDKNVVISHDTFVELLKSANLHKTIENLDLDKKSNKNKKLK